MKKIVGIILIVILIVVIGELMFTRIGKEIRSAIYYKITTPKETITMEDSEKIAITYTYIPQGDSFEIEVTDKELIEMIKNNVLDKKLNNYSGQVGLAVFGEYTVSLGNDVNFKFDTYDDDGYVIMCNKDKIFLTRIKPEILSKVIDIVDIKLTENASMFQTKKVTITDKEENQVNIERTTAIEYILKQSKNIYTKEIDYEPNLVEPDYVINFNNGIKIFKYKQSDQGFLQNQEILYEAYGLSALDTILENAFDNVGEKEQIFNTSKITITTPKKTIEITDENVIEKIITPIIYSNIQETEWTKNYDISEEYENGIKVKMNNYEFLIPGKIGTVTIGNRYIITEDRKVSLCFPLQDIEEYINELLEKYN